MRVSSMWIQFSCRNSWGGEGKYGTAQDSLGINAMSLRHGQTVLEYSSVICAGGPTCSTQKGHGVTYKNNSERMHLRVLVEEALCHFGISCIFAERQSNMGGKCPGVTERFVLLGGPHCLVDL